MSGGSIVQNGNVQLSRRRRRHGRDASAAGHAAAVAVRGGADADFDGVSATLNTNGAFAVLESQAPPAPLHALVGACARYARSKRGGGAYSEYSEPQPAAEASMLRANRFRRRCSERDCVYFAVVFTVVFAVIFCGWARAGRSGRLCWTRLDGAACSLR
jgi:hypothetical protein